MRWRRWRASVVVRVTWAAGLVWSVSACTATNLPAPAPSPTPARPGAHLNRRDSGTQIDRHPVVDRGGTGRLAATCAPGELRGLVDRFVRAFNAGNQPELERLWASQGQGFSWYSTDSPGQRLRSAARDRATLGTYFARRHAAGEHLAVTSFHDNGSNASSGGFGLTLVRRADGLPSTAYVGKGTAFCQDNPATLAVWSMAKDTVGG